MMKLYRNNLSTNHIKIFGLLLISMEKLNLYWWIIEKQIINTILTVIILFKSVTDEKNTYNGLSYSEARRRADEALRK